MSLPYDYDPEKEESMGLISYKKMAGQDVRSKMKMFFDSIKRVIKHKTSGKRIEEMYESDKDESHDWWSKYYASLEVDTRFPLENFLVFAELSNIPVGKM